MKKRDVLVTDGACILAPITAVNQLFTWGKLHLSLWAWQALFSHANTRLIQSVRFSRLPFTVWCSEIGSLWSLDAPEFHASSDVRGPISLHQAVGSQKLVLQMGACPSGDAQHEVILIETRTCSDSRYLLL